MAPHKSKKQETSHRINITLDKESIAVTKEISKELQGLVRALRAQAAQVNRLARLFETRYGNGFKITSSTR